MSDFINLAEPPAFVLRWPLCGSCTVELDHDGDGFICPSCGSTWRSDADDGEQGELVSSWSGEDPIGPALTEDEARQVAQYREAVEKHTKWGQQYPALYPMPRHRPAVLDRIEASR